MPSASPSLARSSTIPDCACAELVDRETYQDHAARNERLQDIRARARTYQVALGTTQEAREALVRAAEREARTLTALSDHPNILKLKSYVPDGPTGAPCIVFEDFEGGQPLDAFLRSQPKLSLEHRLDILQQLAEALGYCHRKEVLHRALSPSSVLVRMRERGHGSGAGQLVPEIRLLNFQLATAVDAASSGTSHRSHWYVESEDIYVAPEVLHNPSHATTRSDVFSLGALAYLVLTGRAPGADLAERATLMKPGYLSLATVRDDLAAGVGAAEDDEAPDLETVMEFATNLSPIDREGDAVAWITELLEALTAPTPPPADTYVPPNEARKGQDIAPGMLVVDVLGTGSTARTLRVKTDDGTFALKVALSADMDARLDREAETLRDIARGEIAGDRIVRLHKRLELGGRTCLLMTDAGKTLARLLADEGAQSLDYARRWGEDLLLALSHLEERGLQHRDIKPGNLGVLTGQKKKRHLLLFDFSLSGVRPQDVRAGTPAYRDPFLGQRGAWDHAADRYAAALTLHELLTGDRPRWGADDIPTATDGPITLSAERFDASARERLVHFFDKALARDVADRFDSAETMRTEWLACFSTHVSPGVVQAIPQVFPPTVTMGAPPEATAIEEATSKAASEQGPPSLPPGLSLETAVEALPLGNRAKNALFRAGVLDVRALLQLPDNQLSAMRGVGRDTALHIHALANREEFASLRAQLAAAHAPSDAFFPGFAGARVGLRFVQGLSDVHAQRLLRAGLADLVDVAATPAPRVEHILEQNEAALAELRNALSAAHEGGAERETTLDALLTELLPVPTERRGDRPLSHVRALFGLDPVGGAYHDSVASLAAASGVTRALLYAALSKLRDTWAQAPALGELHDRFEAALAPSLGMASVSDVAREMARQLLPAAEAAEPLDEARQRAAAALVRVALETRAGYKLARIAGGPWVVPDALDPKALQRLGALADTLAAADPLLSPGAVAERLHAHVQQDDAADGPLGEVPADRLVALAARASARARKSARLELYPAGLSPARALDLCVGALPPAKLTPELLQQIVAARYPDSAPLPGGDELRQLMDARGYAFDSATGAFARKRRVSDTRTEGTLTRAPTTHSAHRQPDPDAHEFAQDIAVRHRRGSFCVLEASPARADEVARELQRRHGIERISLEAALLRHMREAIARMGIEDDDLVYATDRQGPESPEWPNLRALMQEAAGTLLTELCERTQPMVLTEPGLLARYQLTDLLRGLLARAKQDDAPAVFVLVPSADEIGGARIAHPDGDLPLPLTTQAQRLRVPQAWLENRDKGASL